MSDVPQNTTRTVQIEVCGECKEDIRKGQKHYFICPECFRQRCKNTAERFTVQVDWTKPHGYPKSPEDTRTAFPGWLSGQEKQLSFRGDFCYECGDRIQQILKAAGLSELSKPRSRQRTVMVTNAARYGPNLCNDD